MTIAIIQILIVLAALYLGSRYGSLALGAISGIAIAILVFGFGLKPGTPPTDVIYIIIAAVCCASVLQTSGGMDWLIQIAERLLRKNPEKIIFLAPLSTFLLTVLVGTGHVVYTLMPIIVDISIKKGIRPERPCAVASIASQVGITCSPIAAAVVSFVAISNSNGFDITIPQVLLVTLPACLIGLMAAALLSVKRGKDLDKDENFQKLISNPEKKAEVYGIGSTTLDKKISRSSRLAVYIFLGALATVVCLASFGCPVKMNLAIQIIMLSAAGLMIVFCKVKPSNVTDGSVWKAGMVAVVAIFGIAWMADTYFANYLPQIKDTLSGVVSKYPWTISLVFFTFSILLNSQGAVVVSMLPLAYSLGIPGPILLGVFPAVYGYFFIPNYPSDIATVNFDRTGTTRIGKYLLNHSFMMPGLVSVAVATIIGYAITCLLFPGYFNALIH